MPAPLSLFLLAGEPSGDRIGADLVRRLRTRTELVLTGVGGEEMTRAGLSPIFAMSDLAVMGITDVILNLPRLLWRVEQTARAILAAGPDIVVLVDAQEFSRLVAIRLRAKGFARPVLLYVAPSVWARHPERATKLVGLFDEVLAVLPFEPEAMRRLGGPPTVYVGHPALAEAREGLLRERGRLAVLPGSRLGELRRHLPLLAPIVQKLARDRRIESVFIPALGSSADTIRLATVSWGVPVEIATDRAARPALYAQSVMALVAAGTATLELALAGVPMAIFHIMDAHQARVYETLRRPPVGLPNIILNEPVVPERIEGRPDVTALLGVAEDLLASEEKRLGQIAAFSRMVRLMETGAPGFAREAPEERVLAHLPRGRVAP